MKKVNISEQHISPIKLEKQRQRAYKRGHLVKIGPIAAFLVFMIMPTLNIINFFTSAAQKDPADVKNLLIYFFIHDVLMAVVGSAAVFALLFVFYQKAYNLFNNNFKNKYVLDTLRELSGFQDLSYTAQMSYSFEEMCEAAIIPTGTKSFFTSNDDLTGSYKNVKFRSGNVQTTEAMPGSSRLLFSGQVIEFSYFDKSKISDGRVQIFSNKSLAFYQKLYERSNDELMRDGKLGFKIETEDIDFNKRFSVYSDNEHNAFYMLTPVVMENIKAMADTADDNLFIVFCNEKLFVALNSFVDPFDVYIDVPIEKQRKQLENSTTLLKNAVNILIK